MVSFSISPDAVTVPSGRRLVGRVRVPASKSLTHRVLALALLARRPLVIEGALDADDTRRTLAAVRAAGIAVEASGSRLKMLPGPMPDGPVEVDCGEAGTALRLLTGLLATQTGEWRLMGRGRLAERPLAPLAVALQSLGVSVEFPEREGYAPVVVRGGGLGGGRVRLDAGSSSQFLSGLLLAGLAASGPLEIEVERLTSKPYVDLTVMAIEMFGGRVERDGLRFRVLPGLDPPQEVSVDGDDSSAAYWAAAAALTGGRVEIDGLNPDSRHGDRGFVDLLVRMGARAELDGRRRIVTGTGRLRALDVALGDMPDQVPTLAALAPFAEGTTRIRDVAHLRLKESDRLAAIRFELRRAGVPVVERSDGLEIPGVWSAAPADAPVALETWGDHRIAMSLAVLGLRRSNVTIRAPRVVDKSYPGFWDDLARLVAD